MVSVAWRWSGLESGGPLQAISLIVRKATPSTQEVCHAPPLPLSVLQVQEKKNKKVVDVDLDPSFFVLF